MKFVLSARHFHDEASAYRFLEERVWPNGPVCPHCGGVERISKMEGKSTRVGVYKCYQCRMQFSVKVGTVFESSHVKLNIWLQAVALLSSSKKGISSNQLHRTLGVSLKTAWFMSHRLREAMREGKLPGGMGGDGKFVEADETYVGGKAKNRAYKDPPPKEAVMSLVERGGKVRSHHVMEVTAKTLKPILVDAIREGHTFPHR